MKDKKQYITKEEAYPVYYLHYELSSYNELPITKKQVRILHLADSYNRKAQSILESIYNAQDIQD